MKTIKVKLVGFWDGMDFYKDIKLCPLFWIMNKNYNVVFCDNPNDADYIICSCLEPFYEYCNYPQVRIMYSAENYIPDFNLIDYGISPYPIDFLDRHYSLPACFIMHDRCMELSQKDRNYPESFLKSKEHFANFIFGHQTEDGMRERFFEEISKYKRVESPGKYLNNRNHAENFLFFDDKKTEFQRKCKFTLCFESTKHEGFITEKILDAFFADTIPIYYGSSTVKSIFNEKAFIDISDYKSFADAIKVIEELDQNDDKYLEMLRQPVFKNANIVSETYAGLEKFVCDIFDKPLDEAYRRSIVYNPKVYNQYLKRLFALSKLAYTPDEFIDKQMSSRDVLKLFLNKANKSLKRRFFKKQ